MADTSELLLLCEQVVADCSKGYAGCPADIIARALKSRLQAEAPTREQVAAEIYSAFPFPDNMRGPNSDACLSWEKAPAHAREVTYRRADAILALPGLRTSQAEAQAPAVLTERVPSSVVCCTCGRSWNWIKRDRECGASKAADREQCPTIRRLSPPSTPGNV